jgi:hypothetical protein
MASLILAGLTFAAAVAVWGGLGWLLANVTPTRPLAVIAAYVFAFVAITGSVSVVVWLARRPRSDDGQLKSPAGYMGHAMLLAIIILFGMWLQALRTLTPVVAVLLVGLYAVLELAVLFGTRGSIELPIRHSS